MSKRISVPSVFFKNDAYFNFAPIEHNIQYQRISSFIKVQCKTKKPF